MSAVRWCNGIAAVLHLVSLIAVFAIGFKPETIQRTTWELKQDTVSIRIQDAGPAAAAGVCDTAPPNTFSFGDTVLDVSTFPGRAAWAKLSLFWLVVGFFALSGVFQGGVELSGLLWWMKGEVSCFLKIISKTKSYAKKSPSEAPCCPWHRSIPASNDPEVWQGIYDKMFPDGVTQAAVVSEVVGLPVAHGSVGQAPSADPAVRPPGTGAVLPLPQAAALLRRRHLVWAGAKGGAVPMTPTARVDKCTVYINWLRYVEYSISATVMLVSISLVAGVNDLDVLVCMSIMCGSCMLLGMVAEYSFRMHIFLKSMPRDDDVGHTPSTRQKSS